MKNRERLSCNQSKYIAEKELIGKENRKEIRSNYIGIVRIDSCFHAVYGTLQAEYGKGEVFLPEKVREEDIKFMGIHNSAELHNFFELLIDTDYTAGRNEIPGRINYDNSSKIGECFSFELSEEKYGAWYCIAFNLNSDQYSPCFHREGFSCLYTGKEIRDSGYCYCMPG